tara:strand:+ start:1896 stop:2159 length:264 start_codon:yes stop_codon:yes gene_type:complete
MEKEENKTEVDNQEIKEHLDDNTNDESKDKEIEKENNKKEKSSEEKIIELEDKLARTFAEMENQRRRFEKKRWMLLSMEVMLSRKKH